MRFERCLQVANKKTAKTKPGNGAGKNAAQEIIEESKTTDPDADVTQAVTEPVDAVEDAAGEPSDSSDMSSAEDAESADLEHDHEAEGGDMPEPGDDVELQDDDSPSDDIDDASDNPHVDDLPPEVAPVIEEKVVERVIEKRGGFLPALIGGIAAAVIGFVAGRGDLLDPFLPSPSAGLAEQVTEIDGTVTTLNEAVSTLNGQLDETTVQVSSLQEAQSDGQAALEALTEQVGGISIPDLSGVEGGLGEVTQTVSSLTTNLGDTTARLSDVADRLTAIEKRPLTEALSEDVIGAYERELTELQGVIEDQQAAVGEQIAAQADILNEQRAELEAALAAQKEEVAALLEEAKAIEASAKAAETSAQIQTHLAEVSTAIDAGEPFTEALDALKGLGVDPAPELADAGADGVPTMAALQTDFIPAARAALSSARESEGAAPGLGSFLQRQLGARAVTPQDGDGPNAVLSRIEAAVRSGDLKSALDEANALPDAAKSELADWLSAAQARQAAAQALSAMIADTSSN